jgi:hypothetical protein
MALQRLPMLRELDAGHAGFVPITFLSGVTLGFLGGVCASCLRAARAEPFPP